MDDITLLDLALGEYGSRRRWRTVALLSIALNVAGLLAWAVLA